MLGTRLERSHWMQTQKIHIDRFDIPELMVSQGLPFCGIFSERKVMLEYWYDFLCPHSTETRKGAGRSKSDTRETE